MTSTPVTMLGQNPRSGAVVRVLQEQGHLVTDDAPLVLVMAEDYAAAQKLVDSVSGGIGGRDLVNLTSGTSEQAQGMAARVTAHGGRYLDGALMAHPEHVGRGDTVLVYSGAAELYDHHEGVLQQLGRATYLGADPGAAALYDLAMLNFAWATLVGFLQTSALLRTGQVAAGTAAPLLTHWLATTVTDVIEDYAAQVDEGRYPGDEEWLELDFPLMDHLVEATEARGLDAGLPRLVRTLTAKGIAAGNGSDSFASLVEVIGHGPGSCE
jgi:3-hydroxyisobutyrate dehydrogenase-like beta-hydroxyacid dehydrogenase